MAKKNLKELIEFGILNIDKPSGPTSFEVAEKVGKIIGARKFSHFGTLDPKVSGVLPIALNRACKLTGFFISHNKEYVGIARFHEEVDLNKTQKIINEKFLGKIKQIPPVRSRVKRQERTREIYSFNLIEKKGKDILFEVKCQGGTYIRKLIDDLGKELGIGAHMLELRRKSAGIFSEEDKEFINLYELEKTITNQEEALKIIVPAEEAIKKVFNLIHVKFSEINRLFTGKAVYFSDISREINLKKFPHNSMVGVFAENKEETFIGVYKVVLEKEIFAKPEFVMQPLNKK
jgi:H/ACA ribonucleoprotein complex subunit 4